MRWFAILALILVLSLTTPSGSAAPRFDTPPVAIFYVDPPRGMVPLTVTFTNASQNATSYLWDYGDGTIGTSSAPTHTHVFGATGAFTVTLTAINPQGSDTLICADCVAVYAVPIPQFSATPTSGLSPLTVSFTNRSLNATDYVWDFGDGGYALEPDPVHTYSSGGVYTVALMAYNLGGSAWLTRTDYITVYPGPVVAFAGIRRIGAGPLSVTFQNNTLNATSYQWDYGDGLTSTVTATTHTHVYPAASVYTVTLSATNSYGTNILTRPGYVAVYAASPDTVYYVDGETGSNATGSGSEAAPWQTIGYALGHMAGTGLELRVASGTYGPASGETFPITMQPGISVRGTGALFTTVEYSGSAPAFLFSSTSAFTYTTTVLSNFTIRGCNTAIRIEGIAGAGTAPAIRDNRITANAYGIIIWTSNGRRAYPLIAGNLIDDNSQYGLYLVAEYGNAIAAPTAENNAITHNGRGGIYCTVAGAGSPNEGNSGACNPVLRNNTISYNHGDALTCHSYYCGGCSPVLTANTMANNGGWAWKHEHANTYLAPTRPVFANNMIYGNAGGALFVNSISADGYRDAPTFINDTIAYNGSSGILDGYPSIVNSIIWGHSTDLNAQVSAVSYSDVSQGLYVGQNHNVSFDPQFVDPTQGNFHLLRASPVIDLGNGAAANLPDFDFDGNPRVMGLSVDIGADETWVSLVYLPVLVLGTAR